MKIIRPRQAAEKCGIGIPTLWNWVRNKQDFPRPVRLSGGVSGFVEEEIDSYLERKVAEYRAAPEKRETAMVAGQKSAQARRQRQAQGGDHAA